jgi:hypothetical protein
VRKIVEVRRPAGEALRPRGTRIAPASWLRGSFGLWGLLGGEPAEDLGEHLPVVGEQPPRSASFRPRAWNRPSIASNRPPLPRRSERRVSGVRRYLPGWQQDRLPRGPSKRSSTNMTHCWRITRSASRSSPRENGRKHWSAPTRARPCCAALESTRKASRFPIPDSCNGPATLGPGSVEGWPQAVAEGDAERPRRGSGRARAGAVRPSPPAPDPSR